MSSELQDDGIEEGAGVGAIEQVTGAGSRRRHERPPPSDAALARWRPGRVPSPRSPTAAEEHAADTAAAEAAFEAEAEVEAGLLGGGGERPPLRLVPASDSERAAMMGTPERGRMLSPRGAFTPPDSEGGEGAGARGGGGDGVHAPSIQEQFADLERQALGWLGTSSAGGDMPGEAAALAEPRRAMGAGERPPPPPPPPAVEAVAAAAAEERAPECPEPSELDFSHMSTILRLAAAGRMQRRAGGSPSPPGTPSSLPSTGRGVQGWHCQCTDDSHPQTDQCRPVQSGSPAAATAAVRWRRARQ